MGRERYGDMVIPEFNLLKGDCLETLKQMEDNSIDAVLCDPPYHLTSTTGSNKGFMGKDWDGGDIAFRTDVWKECYRVLKPGGHLVAFGGTRTIHRITCAIEDSGFEIRDQLNWLYFSGFPKSHDVSKGIDRHLGAEREVVGTRNNGSATGSIVTTQTGSLSSVVDITKPATPEAQKWEGWGTALKPAAEMATLARKPLENGLTVAQNVLKWGTGGLNIDKSRFRYGDPCWIGPQENKSGWHKSRPSATGKFLGLSLKKEELFTGHDLGRWPANIYQCPKPSRAEKEAGLEHLTSITGAEATGREEGSAGLTPRAGAGRSAAEIRNTHPTVKPVQLFSWLANLICRPGGIILDPFLGSGTTAVSGILEGFDIIGCELTPEYWPIIEGRVAWAHSAWRDKHRQYKLF
jgi:DNA modification methylase